MKFKKDVRKQAKNKLLLKFQLFFPNVSNTKFCELFYMGLILLNILKSRCKININTREIKHRVFGKRQTWICQCYVTKFSIYLSFTVYYIYTKIGRFTPILSITIVFSWFYLLISHFEHFSTWISRLPFAVNAMLNLSTNTEKSGEVWDLNLYKKWNQANKNMGI